jgi:hypothetical protein
MGPLVRSMAGGGADGPGGMNQNVVMIIAGLGQKVSSEILAARMSTVGPRLVLAREKTTATSWSFGCTCGPL